MDYKSIYFEIYKEVREDVKYSIINNIMLPSGFSYPKNDYLEYNKDMNNKDKNYRAYKGDKEYQHYFIHLVEVPYRRGIIQE